ncbi:hypothetical protein EI555_015196, partial [Monodon monoceros]
MENREFYYDFWFEEATDLVTKHDIQMKLCGKFCRACQGNLESQLTFEVIINSQCSNSGGHYSASWRKIPRSAPQSPHIKTRIISSSTCQRSTVPTRIEFIPRGSSGKRGEDKVLLSTIYDVLQLPDIYDEDGEEARMQASQNTLPNTDSTEVKSQGFVTVTLNTKHDLDFMRHTQKTLHNVSELP